MDGSVFLTLHRVVGKNSDILQSGYYVEILQSITLYW